MSNLKSRGKRVPEVHFVQGLKMGSKCLGNSLSAGTGGEVVLLSSKTVELGANIKLAAAAWKRKLEEEERKKRQRQGNKRKRPRLKKCFKKNARKEEDLVNRTTTEIVENSTF